MASTLIAAHSLVTSLGGDAATSCAAARAGLVRTHVIEGLRFISSVDGEPTPVIVHAAPLITHGFEGTARLERLLASALTELKPLLPETLANESSIGFYLSLPSLDRTLTGLDLIANDETKAGYAELAEGLDEEPIDTGFAHRLMANAASQAGFKMAPDLRHVSFAGHAGGVHCMAAAADDLAQQRVSMAIVGGLDSLLDEATLEWLHGASRLKLADMPVGLRPGEACALLALVHPSQAGAVASPFEVVHMGTASEDRTLLSGATSVGITLAEVLEAAAEPAGWRDATPAWLVCDHNGETYRANEWGHALVRLRAQHPALDAAQLWMPAESFGDTGSASALVSVCVALAAFERNYAPASRAVIVSASESQMRAALVLGSSQPHGATPRGAYGRA